MPFPDIDHSLPKGNQKGSILDDSIRETRLWAKTVFGLISGFPDIEAIILPVWDSASRPVGALKENLVGYNEELKQLETVQNGAWTPLALVVEDTEKVSGIRITIGTTAPTSPQIDKELWFDTGERITKVFTVNGWIKFSGVYLQS
ncbi:hypothetical protein [Anaeroselena agilis]|uniref:Uncharacterized protein n=1 Tax=Anaeroselena agilis TaxID=3063788 RepID=A0ABU3NXJ4_9FIRM|nr:hypothetical protein [Selenomonadales bacterium 4137-cl]